MARHPLLPLCALACLAVTATSVGAAQTTVYKCFDAKLNVVYTDQPCRGEQLSFELGTVNHAAIAELAREREAVSRAIAQRIAETNRARLARDYAPPIAYAGPPPDGYGNEVYYPAGWGYYPPTYGDRRGRFDDARPPAHRQRDRAPPHVPASRGDLIKR